jgi:hypothetical protein
VNIYHEANFALWLLKNATHKIRKRSISEKKDRNAFWQCKIARTCHGRFLLHPRHDVR